MALAQTKRAPLWIKAPQLQSSFLLWHTPLREKVVLIVLFHTAIHHEDEESSGRVHHDVAEPILVCLFIKPAVVTRVDHVTPAILRRVNVHLWNAEHDHFLEVPITIQPTNPVAAWDSANPNPSRA